jgi:hypothetical protein
MEDSRHHVEIEPSKTQAWNNSNKITVDKDELLELINQNKELKEVLKNSVSMFSIILDLFGGEIPKSPIKIGLKLPKIIGKLSSDETLLKKFSICIEAIKNTVPKYLNQEQAQQLGSTENKKIN